MKGSRKKHKPSIRTSIKHKKDHTISTTATIEGLHASFDKINTKVKEMIQLGKTDYDLSCCIQKAWAEQFHTSLSPVAVKGMILHYRTIHKGTRKTRKQRGGMAPLGTGMSQGTTAQTFGTFPVGFTQSPAMVSALDRSYTSGAAQSCNPSQSGGGFWDAVMNGAIPRSVPPSTFEKGYDAITATRSGIVGGSSAVTANPSHMTFDPKPYDASGIAQISRLQAIA